MILGNLLNQAARAIPLQDFIYYEFDSRSTNSIGLDVAVYNDAVTLRGSVQAVPRSVYQNQGLDFQKNYINIYVSRDILDIKRDVSGDKIEWDNKTYLCESSTPWLAMDGWNAILCVEVSSA